VDDTDELVCVTEVAEKRDRDGHGEEGTWHLVAGGSSRPSHTGLAGSQTPLAHFVRLSPLKGGRAVGCWLLAVGCLRWLL